jgi:hypothetical protein
MASVHITLIDGNSPLSFFSASFLNPSSLRLVTLSVHFLFKSSHILCSEYRKFCYLLFVCAEFYNVESGN